ncbi:acyl carrier protein [Streptomyces parvus]
MTEQAVLERVLELTARHLGHRPDEVSADRTFVGLGADSLQLIGMVRQLEAEFGTEISMREVLEEAGTPRLTAALIAGRAVPATVPASVPVSVPVAAAVPEAAAVAAPVADEPGYATQAEVAALSEQIRQLAETQAAMLTQLSDAVALLTARTTGTDAR